MDLKQKQTVQLSNQETRDLRQENLHLKKQLRDLMDSVGSYRGTQRRFENFELQLLECQNFGKLLQCLIETLEKEFQLDAVSLTLFDPNHLAIEMLEYTNPYPQQLKFIDNYSGLCEPIMALQNSPYWSGKNAATLRPLLGSNSELIELAWFQGKGIKSVAILPLIRENLLIGYSCMGSFNEDRFAANLATELLSHLSAVIAVCLENTLSREQIHQLSQIDMLTRVKNRRAYDKALRQEISRSKREQLPLSCLFADLDYFKIINDTYGHPTGDRTLKAVASSIQELLRETDVLARIGGEEFTILLPNTESDRAQEIAERIRRTVETLVVKDDAGKRVNLTTSIGYTTWLPELYNDESVDDVHRQLMAAADKAVYKAKQSGRNRVTGKTYTRFSVS